MTPKDKNKTMTVMGSYYFVHEGQFHGDSKYIKIFFSDVIYRPRNVNIKLKIRGLSYIPPIRSWPGLLLDDLEIKYEIEAEIAQNADK